MLKDAAAQPDNKWLQDRIANSPLITEPYHSFLFDAFWELSTERQIGMSLGPIPVTAMMSHADLYDLTKPETLAFIKVMRAMDNLYLGIERESAAKSSKKSQTRTR